MADFLELRNISKYFTVRQGQLHVLDDVSFAVDEGELVCLLGSSGCGKTTTLRIIAGLEKQTSGEVLLNSRKISGTSRERILVFQEPRLFPWLTLEENIAFGIKGHVEKNRLRQIVQDLLQTIGLQDFAQAMPHQLSGGMAHRAAIARALAADPLLLLLDEPFAALDAQTRAELQADFLRIWQISQKTCIHVTHDIDEALILGRKIIIMGTSPGSIREIIPVPFPYPRCPDDPEFLALKKQIRTFYNKAI